MQRYAKVKCTGMYIPEKRITNAELGAMIGYDVDKYLDNKGIKVRFQSAPDESTSTHLAYYPASPGSKKLRRIRP
jgi:3-oxoacyl-[acyl-carrier-protein] synthase-3